MQSQGENPAPSTSGGGVNGGVAVSQNPPGRQEPDTTTTTNLDSSVPPTETPVSPSPASDPLQLAATPLPVQKRRRVTRACDECRRKKIKCDGKQPCTHCTVYSYACTYDQPSNRRRNPAPQYIEALETRLNKAEALLRVVLPELDLEDPRFDALGPEEILSALKKTSNPVDPPAEAKPKVNPEPCDESLLESMVDNTGTLDLDDQGNWDYHGHSSGLIFVRRLRKQFGNIPEPRHVPQFQQLSQMIDSSKASSESPVDSHHLTTQDLPSRDVARKLCSNALDDSSCLMRFLHKPTFYEMLDRIYDTPPDQFSNEENSFLPLLYLALAVGCLFRSAGDSALDKFAYQNAADQGFQYYRSGRQLLDITECRDLTSLQAVCFMILFLQSTANVRTCYSYIGIALRAALRLGLHRSVSANFNPIEQETRKRVFWVVRKMDVHVSSILGLPILLSEDDVDQEYPLAVDDEFITAEKILPMPPGYTPLMAGATAHIALGRIVLKVMRYIYPVKSVNPGSDHTYKVSHSKIRELEGDLQTWLEALPAAFRPGGEATPEVERIRQLLRIGYAHVQMAMYRPFLHYVTGGPQGQKIDKRSYACAAACVSVARNVVHITAGMKKKQLLNGSYWFTMYTTYFAILSLLFFILENPECATAREGILKDALEGKNTLAGLAKNSMAADRCAQSLNSIFKHLPEKLRNRQSTGVPVSRKRAQGSPPPALSPATTSEVRTPAPNAEVDSFALAPPARAKTFPVQILASDSSKAATKLKQQTLPTSADDTHTSTGARTWSLNDPSQLASSQPISTVPSLLNEESRQVSSPSSPLSTSQSQPQQSGSKPGQQPMTFSPPLHNAGYLPDLMPMMFPSDDPFAYPAQPMSMLEDDNIRNEMSAKFPQWSSVATTSSNGTPTASTPSYDQFSNLQNLSNQGSSSTNTGLPYHLKTFPQFSDYQSMTPTPSHVTESRTESLQTALQDIPDNLFWPEMGSQQASQPQSQPSRLSNEQVLQDTPDFGMGMGLGMTDFGALGMAMHVDDLLGNLGGTAAANNGPIDWNQWMDTGI
ncbi:hypothetical protein AJ80_05763 [Polytolypa hystricis UAMH7299]|uniref:Zn(2)-C6 fungal-type domain-containing protein n=1 Tax=Polytolypa hystricis (strain UAMH7299) TaxID=1447883 RepID=A0A2B7Y2A0_POLH7|nr:hypothetical protein AJ80_05763 [Polytolypa hystricis UAMH7299]